MSVQETMLVIVEHDSDGSVPLCVLPISERATAERICDVCESLDVKEVTVGLPEFAAQLATADSTLRVWVCYAEKDGLTTKPFFRRLFDSRFRRRDNAASLDTRNGRWILGVELTAKHPDVATEFIERLRQRVLSGEAVAGVDYSLIGDETR